MSFRRTLVTGDDQDLDLNQCVHLLRAMGGSVSFGFHGFGDNNRGVFETQLCLQDCVGKYNYYFFEGPTAIVG